MKHLSERCLTFIYLFVFLRFLSQWPFGSWRGGYRFCAWPVLPPSPPPPAAPPTASSSTFITTEGKWTNLLMRCSEWAAAALHWMRLRWEKESICARWPDWLVSCPASSSSFHCLLILPLPHPHPPAAAVPPWCCSSLFPPAAIANSSFLVLLFLLLHLLLLLPS